METSHVELHTSSIAAWEASSARDWASSLAKSPSSAPINLRDAVRGLYDRETVPPPPAPDQAYSVGNAMTLLNGLYEHTRCRSLAILSDEQGRRSIDWAAIVALVRVRCTFLDRVVQPTDDASRWQLTELLLTWNTRCISAMLSVDQLEGAAPSFCGRS